MARILSDEQARQGMRSSALSVISADLRKEPLSAPLHTLAAGVDKYALKTRSFSAPISLLRDATPGLESVLPQDTEIIHLHGINGALSMNSLAQLAEGRKIVWTLHDMNPFTGACHYSLGCARFISGCSGCPAVRAAFRGLVEANFARKIATISEIPNLSLVAPSAWLADEARGSAVFRDNQISVIPNPVDPAYLHNDIGVGDTSEGGFRAITIAKNLSDPVKAIDVAVSAFQEAAQGSTDAKLTLVGSGGEAFAGPSIHLTGQLSTGELAQELSDSDVLIVPSRAENAPLVIAEAAARGCAPLVADVGGMTEMITTLGYGKTFSSPQELTSLLKELLARRGKRGATARRKVAQAARSQFSPEVIVARYGKVYEGNR